MNGGAQVYKDLLDAKNVGDNMFIADHDGHAVNRSGDNDNDDKKPKSGQRQGPKRKIEFLQDKSKRGITFCKRKAGIMKKAYELSTLTGCQILLIAVSETGLVYTFSTAKFQPLVSQPWGKSLIHAYLNADTGLSPSTAMGEQPPAPVYNMPGGLSIGGGSTNSSFKEDENAHGGHASGAPSSGPSQTAVSSPTFPQQHHLEYPSYRPGGHHLGDFPAAAALHGLADGDGTYVQCMPIDASPAEHG
ncbi:SRF-type transcription factor (DNA-binding and dimerization domain)-domain-containing protein [Mycena olivaceomarginata]|nr:SRF-type transcription factor (DNA-binding and dimerization domain)-domain-containing protein [Mycena olivaceomarginata]KAJ7879772.1 SRF-type transcription factor (DNA-binding and dimerization domain)-domain-containing protein [Mycena olivaceomarginata]KAJ7889057.1 SRF-type transcription factor (DNA-binding and dimerization domain)-domain-containing protein [Mycena olivaceomarginata]